MAALEIVSVGDRTTDGLLKDGLEIYHSIGNLENSDRDYLNVSNHSIEPLLYQLGHVIEREISFAETPDQPYARGVIYQILTEYWYNNLAEDAISVSRHGYMKPIDDILEFSKYYAYCTQTNELSTLSNLSPGRYTDWDACLTRINDYADLRPATLEVTFTLSDVYS